MEDHFNKDVMMDDYQPTTLGKLFYRVCRSYPDNEAIVFQNQRVTYCTFFKMVQAVAKSLAKLGVKKGDHIGLWMSNRPEFMYVQFAAALLGGVLVVINPRYRSHELSHALSNLEINYLVMMDMFLNIDYLEIIYKMIPELETEGASKRISDTFPSLKGVILLSKERRKRHPIHDLGGLIEEGLHLGGDEEISRRMNAVNPDDAAMIMLTSGTTGHPKGVILTHNSICWSNSWAFPGASHIRPSDRMLSVVPLTTTGGSLSFSVTSATCGTTLLLTEKFDPEESLLLAQNEHCTFIRGVPAMYAMWLNSPALETYDLSSVERGITSGAPISPAVLEEVMERITPNMLTAYGMTEFSCLTSQTVLSDPLPARLTTAGRPYAGAEVKAFNMGSGLAEEPGKVGELRVRGPHVMRGYYKQPELTAETVDADGWLRTGDLGFIDEDGCISIVGRCKEMLITGGFNVYPREVECVLETHSKVKLAAVVGIPDSVMGEVPVAFVETKEGVHMTEQEVIEFCRSEMANYKVPKRVAFLKEWPMVGIGKIDKMRLRDRLMDELKGR